MSSVVENVIAAHVYALNKSKSKLAVVGLSYRDVDTWRPRVVLCGQYWAGVSLALHEWREVMKHANKLSDFVKSGRGEPEIQVSPQCLVYAKTVYEKPAVIFETTDGNNNLSTGNTYILKTYLERSSYGLQTTARRLCSTCKK